MNKPTDVALTPARTGLMNEIFAERDQQDGMWGPEHDDQHSMADFARLIQDYAIRARAMAVTENSTKTRDRLIQVAALSLAAIESIDRKQNCTAAPAPG